MAMARLWKEKRESDLAKTGLVWTYDQSLTLIFHHDALGRGSAPVWDSESHV